MAVDARLAASDVEPPLRGPIMIVTGPGVPPMRLVRELWAARGLVAVLARKDFLVRYRRTKLGLAWAVVLPLVQAVILAVVFSHVVGRVSAAGLGTGTGAYAVFVFSGMVPWSVFSAGMATASTAVVDGSDLARRIYFPRIVLPVVSVLTVLFPLLITMLVLLGMELVLGTTMGLRTLWILPGAALAVALLGALAIFTSVAQVYVRDLRFLVTAALTVLFYATPVIYPLTRLPLTLRNTLVALPTAGPVELFRRSVGAADPHWLRYVVSTLVWTVVVGTAGLLLHSRRDRVMTDLL